MVLDLLSIGFFLLLIILPVVGYLVARWGQEEAGEAPWTDRGYKG